MRKTISYKLQFIDSAKLRASSLSNLADNLAEGIQKVKCENEHDNKTRKTCRIKYKDCKCCLDYTKVKDDLILSKCLCCHENYQKILMKF